MIVIIDYGAGNTANVKNALEKLDANIVISNKENEWKNADALVLPGVGAFGAASKKLDTHKETLIELIKNGKPFLGICLGMQLLFEKSEESLDVQGLSIIKGKVKRFNKKSDALIIPHMGWNLVESINNCPLFNCIGTSKIPTWTKIMKFRHGVDKFYAYFAHSYFCEPANESVVCAYTKYGEKFTSALWTKNIFATQFHPEKSGEIGLKILKNFLGEVKR